MGSSSLCTSSNLTRLILMLLIRCAAAVRHHPHHCPTYNALRLLVALTTQALLLCATVLMERATRVVRAAAAVTPPGVILPDRCFRASLLALLPPACAALTLTNSRTSQY